MTKIEESYGLKFVSKIRYMIINIFVIFTKTYTVSTPKNFLAEIVLLSTLNMLFNLAIRK